eukprot:5471827-Amphidinium_carterae.1
MEVGSSLYDRCHDLAVTSGHDKAVSIIPADVPSRGPKASGLWVPTKAFTEGVEAPDRTSSTPSCSSVRPLCRSGRPE